MHIRLYIILFLIKFVFDSSMVISQTNGIPFFRNYTMKDYEGDNQNWDILEDDRGVIYVANQGGYILEYDGVEWRNIYMPNNSTVWCLEKNEDGIIYVGAVNEFGYLSPDSLGFLQYKSLLPLLGDTLTNFRDVWDVKCMNDEVYFQTSRHVIRYKGEEVRIWNFKEEIFRSFAVYNKSYLSKTDNGIMVLEEGEYQNVVEMGCLGNKEVVSMLPYQNNKILLCTSFSGLYLYDPDDLEEDIKKVTTEIDEFFVDIFDGIKIDDHLFAYASRKNGAVIIDEKGKRIDFFNESNSIQSNVVYKLHKGKDHLLWLALSNGICKIDLGTPIKKWDKSLGISELINDITRFRGDLYIATDNGVDYWSENKRYNNWEPHLFKKITDIGTLAWEFLHVEVPFNGIFQSKLLVGTSYGVFQIEPDKTLYINPERFTVVTLFSHRDNSGYVFGGYKDGVLVFKWDEKEDKWSDFHYIEGLKDEIRSINSLDRKYIWAGSRYNGVYKIAWEQNGEKELDYFDDNYIISHYDSINGLPNLPGITYVKLIEGQLRFITQDGIFKYIDKSDSFEKDSGIHETLTKDALNIFRLAEDRKGNLWVSENESEYVLRKGNNASCFIDSLSLIKITQRRIDAIYHDENNITWLGGDGLYRYDDHVMQDFDQKYYTLIRNVKITGDSILFGGTNYNKDGNVGFEQPDKLKTDIKYRDNSIVFEYAAIYYNEPSSIKYCYQLTGFDKDWSEWTSEVKKEYTNLPEGSYIFEVKAKNIYGKESIPAIYEFQINPPWYRTIVAFILYVIAFIFLFIYSIKFYTRRLKEANIRLENTIAERTKEIVKQKNEIEEQAKKLAKLSIVASETENAICILDAECNFEWMNDGYKKLFGYSMEEYFVVKGENLLDSSNNPNIKKIVSKCLTEKKPVIYQSLNESKSREKIWTQTTLNPILDDSGNISKLVTIEADIRKIKEYEKEISDKNEELQIQKDELAALNATKDKFFSIISHDLKSPFNSLLGFGEVMLENFSILSKEKMKIYVEQMHSSSNKLYSLVENLLEWSRSKRGVIKSFKEKFNLLDVVDKVLLVSKLSAVNKNIQLTKDIDKNLNVFADENLLSTVIRNLISNAIKYSHENSTIFISSKINKEFIEVSVTDSGIGISEENRKKLFREDIHYTTKGTNKEKGTGLGLILCKEFVEMNGGKISVESELGKGTTFTFSVPKLS